MKIKTERDKRNYLIIALCAILVVMGVGYAAFSSLLTINGTANISNSWCVGFDNTKTNTMEVTKGLSTGTQPTGTMTYSGTACGSTLQPNLSLNAHFYQPGDQIEYTLTIVNKSTVTAAIKSFTINGNENITSNWTHTDGNITYTVNMPSDTTLSPDETTTMTVIAKFQNETDVSGNVNGETKTLNVSINVEQDDGNGGMVVENGFTGSIYRSNFVSAKIGDSISSSEVSTKWCKNNGKYGCYDSEQQCNNAGGPPSATCLLERVEGIGYKTSYTDFTNKSFLKHDVVNDIITASYVCFVYNNTEHCLKGGDGGTAFADNTLIIKDFQNYYSDYNLSCNYGSVSSSCNKTYMSLDIDLSYLSVTDSGKVNCYGDTYPSCAITQDGSSSCVN